MNRLLAQLRAQVDGNRLVGHAAVFGQTAELPFGYERLASTAFDAALEDPATDVRALLNHNPTLVLGRQSAGTLRLSTDNEGLRFEIDLPDTTYAADLKELVARGDVDGMSFGFIPGKDEFSKAPDGKQIRTHLSVERLLDVSPVTWPAYDGTSVQLRHMVFDVPVERIRRSQQIKARWRAHNALKEG